MKIQSEKKQPHEFMTNMVIPLSPESLSSSTSSLTSSTSPASTLNAKVIIKHWLDDTTSHGFIRINKSNNFLLRIAWILLMCGMVVICGYSIIVNLIEFSKYKVNINYQNGLDPLTSFPDVTVCNLNPYNFEQRATSERIKQILKENNLCTNVTVNETETAMEKVRYISSLLRAATFEEFRTLGFRIETMLVSCLFNGMPCSALNFTPVETYEYGTCYRFSGPLTNRVGPDSGLLLELFVGLPVKQDYYTMARGAFVIVHNASSMPMPRYEGFLVSTGTSSNVAVKRTFYTKQAAPYSTCRRAHKPPTPGVDSTFSLLTLANCTRYSQKLCGEYCIQYTFIGPNCNCTDISIPHITKLYVGSRNTSSSSSSSNSNTSGSGKSHDDHHFDLGPLPDDGSAPVPWPPLPVCKSPAQIWCVKEQRNKLCAHQKVPCSKWCPVECDSVSYSTTVSLADYPTNYYLGILHKQNNFMARLKFDDTFNATISGDGEECGNVLISDKRTMSNVSGRSSSSSSNSGSTEISEHEQNIDYFDQLGSYGGVRKSYRLVQSKLLKNPTQARRKDSESVTVTTCSILKVNVFYEELHYTHIVETPAMPLETLTGVVGGNFGFFLGASLLSIVEIFELCLRLSVYEVRMWRSRISLTS